MKKSKVLAVCATVAVVAGLLLVLWSIPTETNTATFTVPAGLYYYRFETTTLMGGKVSGTFEVTSGDDVTVMVFDETEYKSYESTGYATPLYTANGATGSFDASLSGIGKLYIVFEHESLSSAETDVTIDYKVSGVALTFLVIGVVLIVVGAVLGLVGARARKKERAEMPPSPAASDVTILSPPPESPKT